MLKLLTSISLFFAILPLSFAQIQYIKEDFNNQKVVGSGAILHPTSINFDENGSGYITLKRGIVMVLDTTGQLRQEPLIDISEEVAGDGDHGLLSLALDPNFLNNGYFYLLYVVDRHHLMTYGTSEYDPNLTIEKQATIGRITRYQADVATNFSTTIPESRTVLLGRDASPNGFPVLMISHGVGTLQFAADGTLLASCGDAGGYQAADFGSSKHTHYEQALEDGIIRPKDNVGSFKSQLIDNLAGKIIRIDPQTGEGVPSNPFFDAAQPNAPKSKVWALGFRNPFRFIIEPESGSHNSVEGQPGTLYVGDVGAGSWEELNRVTKGGQNFGWPLFEGLQASWEFWSKKITNFDAPNELSDSSFCDQSHFVFQDLLLEEQLDNNYFYPNPCMPEQAIAEDIPVFKHQRPVLAWSNALWNKPARAMLPTFDSLGQAAGISLTDSSVESAAGAIDGFSAMPAFVYKGDDFPASFENALFVSDYSGWIKTLYFNEQQELIRIDKFLDRDIGIVDVKWNPKDGCIYYIHYKSHSINKICYGGSVPPIADFQIDQQFGASPLTVTFDANASYDPADLELDYHWDFGDGEESTEQNPTHSFVSDNNQPKTFEVILTVTNTDGLLDTKQMVISPNNTPPSVQIMNPKNNGFYGVNDLTYLQLQANVEDLEHSLSDLSYNWQIFFHHNTHYHEEPPRQEVAPAIIIEPTDCATTEVFWYRLRLEVSDANGLTGYDELEIFPYCGDAFFEINHLEVKAVAADRIALSFEASLEASVEKYEVQRTSDFRFETIGEVAANGAITYYFEDTSPIHGRNFYRIKAVRTDGVYDYSNQTSVNFPPEPMTITLYPNPSDGKLTIFTKYPLEKETSIRLFDPLGKLLLHSTWATEIGESNEEQINLSEFNNGIYFYLIDNGNHRIDGRIIIVK